VVLAGLTSARQKAQDSYVVQSTNAYVTALKAYYTDHGYYPFSKNDFDNGSSACLGPTCPCNEGPGDPVYIKNELSEYISSWTNPNPYNYSFGNYDDFFQDCSILTGAAIFCLGYDGLGCTELSVYWPKKRESDYCGVPGARSYTNACIIDRI
jgi:type II secretory pathway pseudopilin PulG